MGTKLPIVIAVLQKNVKMDYKIDFFKSLFLWSCFNVIKEKLNV